MLDNCVNERLCEGENMRRGEGKNGRKGVCDLSASVFRLPSSIFLPFQFLTPCFRIFSPFIEAFELHISDFSGSMRQFKQQIVIA